MPDTNEKKTPSIVMVAAECRGLVKVGGLADVVADLARGLADQGARVRILLPGYESIAQTARFVSTHAVDFAGWQYAAELKRTECNGVETWLIGSARFFGGDYGEVYIDSSRRGKGPFEDDALRFAFFSTAAAHILEHDPQFEDVDLYHVHDWHTGTLVSLARLLGPHYPRLARRPLLFTIHNLDYQGTRPLVSRQGGRFAALADWFPDHAVTMQYHPQGSFIKDPRAPDCYNPMRAGIRLADAVNTVSPTYAGEITQSDSPTRNFIGGRGLEHDLQARRDDRRLLGILNGIDYTEHDPSRLIPPYAPASKGWTGAKAIHKRQLLDSLPRWAPDAPNGLNPRRDPDRPLAVAVTRLASQKVSLLFAGTSRGTVLERLARLPVGVLILGTGELQEDLAAGIARVGASNLCLVPRFDAELATRIYAGGDLFLMPSDFEPCGISQMIAMAYGTLPVATSVGGLADTIEHRKTGFLFSGTTREDAAERFVETVESAARMCREDHDRFHAMQITAMNARFTWERAAKSYLNLYGKLIRERAGKQG